MDRKVEISKEEIRGSKRSMHGNVLTTNDWVRSKINFLVGPQEALLASFKKGKLAWFGHVTRNDSLSKTILQGTKEGLQRRDRRGNAGRTEIKKCTSLSIPALLTRPRACCIKDWRIC